MNPAQTTTQDLENLINTINSNPNDIKELKCLAFAPKGCAEVLIVAAIASGDYKAEWDQLEGKDLWKAVSSKMLNVTIGNDTLKPLIEKEISKEAIQRMESYLSEDYMQISSLEKKSRAVARIGSFLNKLVTLKK